MIRKTTKNLEFIVPTRSNLLLESGIEGKFKAFLQVPMDKKKLHIIIKPIDFSLRSESKIT